MYCHPAVFFNWPFTNHKAGFTCPTHIGVMSVLFMKKKSKLATANILTNLGHQNVNTDWNNPSSAGTDALEG